MNEWIKGNKIIKGNGWINKRVIEMRNKWINEVMGKWINGNKRSNWWMIKIIMG